LARRPIHLGVPDDRTNRTGDKAGEPVPEFDSVADRALREVCPNVTAGGLVEQHHFDPQLATAVISHCPMELITPCRRRRNPDPSGSTQSRGDLIAEIVHAGRARADQSKRDYRKRWTLAEA
jgi:hypothetical protein